ncbi:MAG: PHP domain-containing protein [Nitrospinota bacterium]|nr:PHP domain-containing protein [Nitrospinota bacterium]
MHTSYSDGLDSPVSLLARVKAKGVSVASITDHDTTKGYVEARKAAEEMGIELVTGIEVSSYYKEGAVHMLGYFLDEASVAAQKLVDSNNSGRVERMEKILWRLDRLGYKVDMEQLLLFTGEGTLGRVALARYMVKLGYFRITEDAFYTLLGDGKPAYEAVDRLTPQEAIELIHQAGGVSSLAHPGRNLNEKDVEAFEEAGLDAVEAYNPYHKANDTAKWLDIASRRRLGITGGSDCHGPLWKNHDVGDAGLDIALMEELRTRANTPACGKTGVGGN